MKITLLMITVICLLTSCKDANTKYSIKVIYTDNTQEVFTFRNLSKLGIENPTFKLETGGCVSIVTLSDNIEKSIPTDICDVKELIFDSLKN